MPVDWSKYPPDWAEIAKAAKDAAGWKCERCGMAHMGDGTMGSCLTVHHPDHDPENPDARLEVLCARCHLAAHREEKRARANKDQLTFFEIEADGKCKAS